MREAYGGIFSLTLLATFLVIISSIIAFSLSYSKALRMKEYAITQYEKQECNVNNDFKKSIEAEASRIGYSSNSTCDEQYNVNGICISNNTSAGYTTGTITTFAGIDLPFIKDIFPALKFKITGTSNRCKIKVG